MKILILFSFILLTHFAVGQTKQFDELLSYFHSEKNFNGTVLIATDGQIDYLKAIGLSNRKHNKLTHTQSKFKIASVSKVFTAVLILQLYEQGKIDLNIPFGNYFPAYKGNAKNYVTIEHLMTYSSGIPDESGKLEMKTFQSPLNIDEYIDKYCSNNIVGNPGDTSIYSNTEYIILTKIIEIVNKKTYETVLKENILNPLKMKNSGLINSKKNIKGLVQSYSISESTKTVSPDEPYFVENFFGAGAMYSTAEDLLKFNVGIFKNKLLNKVNTTLMIKPNSKLNNVAFGVWYADGYGTFSKPFIYRTGGILGACSNWIYTLDDKKVIIVLNNTNGTNLYEMSEQFYLLSIGQKSNITKIQK